MKEKTLEELQILQSEMLATATDLGVKIPDDLTVDFATTEVGSTVCTSLDNLIKEFRKGLDANDDKTKTSASEKKSARVKDEEKQALPESVPPATKPRRPRKAAAQPEATKEKETTVTAAAKKSAKKATAKKAAKTAKKATAKKAAKKSSSANARTRAGGLNPDGKITKVQPMPDLRKDTKWFGRLKKVYDAVGKKVSDFTGSKADISSAVKKGLIKIT